MSSELEHGTVQGYWRGCRCEPCKVAKAARQREYRRRQYAIELPPDSPTHGTVVGYADYKCRCQPCKDAKADSMTRYRARKSWREVFGMSK